MRLPLLTTKLRPPPLRDDAVLRSHLLAELDAGLAAMHRLSYVSAPAGFGKTTLLRSWIAASDLRAAWLSLGDQDNEPARFWGYAIAALQMVRPGIGEAARRALQESPSASLQAVMASLINDLEAEAVPLVLVLDDYHAIHNPAVHESVAFFLENQPRHLHLALTTRVDPPLPLARLRARQQLTELRAAHLRFDEDEAATLLNDRLKLALAEEDVQALAERTEGWITGLQLAALSLQSSADRHDFVVAFSGSHRYIVDYLMAEVLAHQPEPVQVFLRRTAILDRFCAPLCERLLTVEPSVAEPAAGLLSQLEQENVFVVPLDEERRWYRYHQLFSDFQYRRLQEIEPELVPELHRRTGHWFRDAGDIETAVHHLLAARDYDDVVALLESHARDILAQGQVVTVETWFNALPEPWRTASVRTNVTFAWALLMRGQYAEALTYLDQAARALADTSRTPDPRHRAELLSEVHGMQSIRARLQGDIKTARTLAEQAVAEAPAEAPYVTGLAYASLGAVYSHAGQTAEAVAAYEVAREAYHRAGIVASGLLAASNLTVLALRLGRLRYAASICDSELAALGEAAPHTPPAGNLYGLRAMLHYERDDVPAARADFDLATRLCRLAGHRAATAYNLAALSHLLLHQGDVAGAGSAIDQARALTEHGAPGWVRAKVIAGAAALALAQDNTEAARRLLQEAEGIEGRQDEVALAHVRLHLYLGVGGAAAELAQAERLVDDVIVDAEARRHGGPLLEALILRAIIHDARGDTASALHTLRRALAKAEPEGYVRIFLDAAPSADEGLRIPALLVELGDHELPAPVEAYRRRLTAAAGLLPLTAERPAQVGPAALPEPLSDRERDVLYLLAQGLTYQEIADRLIVSVNTVRYHIKNLYGKLGADKRTLALARARELGLL